MSCKNLLLPIMGWVSLVLWIEGIGMGVSLHHYRSLSRELNKNSLDLQSFQKQGITSAELDQMEEEKKKYHNEVLHLVRMLQNLQFPLENTVTPQSFQDKLRNRVSIILTKNHPIKFSQNFYLGFDRYRSTLPPQEIAAELDRELEVIFYLFHQFIEIPIGNILSIHRFPLPEESPSFCGPGYVSQKINKRIFDISFMADAPTFRQALNLILKAPYFLTIEALQVRNAQPQPLFKKENPTDLIEKNSHIHDMSSHSKLESVAQEKIKRLFLKEDLIITIRISITFFKLSEEKI